MIKCVFHKEKLKTVDTEKHISSFSRPVVGIWKDWRDIFIWQYTERERELQVLAREEKKI